MNQPQQITCTCSDFQKHQWCEHMPPGAVKTGWNPQQQESWVDRFDKVAYDCYLTDDNYKQEIKAFISTERQRVIEEIKDIIAISAFNIDAGGMVTKRTEAVEVVLNEIMEQVNSLKGKEVNK